MKEKNEKHVTAMFEGSQSKSARLISDKVFINTSQPDFKGGRVIQTKGENQQSRPPTPPCIPKK